MINAAFQILYRNVGSTSMCTRRSVFILLSFLNNFFFGGGGVNRDENIFSDSEIKILLVDADTSNSFSINSALVKISPKIAHCSKRCYTLLANSAKNGLTSRDG